MNYKKLVFAFFALAYPVYFLYAAGPSDYVTTTFSPTEFSKSTISGSEIFTVTIKSSGVCIADVPKPSIANRYTYRYVAKNVSTGEQVVLNPEYISTISPFPQKVGETYEKISKVPLQFPAKSTTGEYVITEEVTKIDMQDFTTAWYDSSQFNKPAAPVKPTAPTQPTAPTKPTAPTGTTESGTQPSKPAEPTQPAEPSKPAEPTAPPAPALPKREIGTVSYVGETETSDMSSASKSLLAKPAGAASVVSEIKVTPSSVQNGETGMGTIRLNIASTKDQTVQLKATPSGVITIPSVVGVRAKATSASFSIRTNTVKSTQKVTITASLNSSTKSADFTVHPLPVTITSLLLSPASVTSGSQAVGTVTLSRTAASGGQNVTLGKSSTAPFTIPANVVVGAGSNSATFKINVSKVSAPTTGTIIATIQGASQKTVDLTVTPAPSACTYTCRPAKYTGRSWSGQPNFATPQCDTSETSQSWMTCPQVPQTYSCGFWGRSRCTAQVSAVCCKK